MDKIELRGVTVSPLAASVGSEQPDKSLPVVVRPATQSDSSLTFLSHFLQDNKAWVDETLRINGAVLFRGFDIRVEADVESTVLSYESNLDKSYRGTSPRSNLGGTEFVFSAADAPSYYPIAQHIEMSFLPSAPRKLFFSCLKAPKCIGGETALADFRSVYQDLPKQLRDKLANKKLRYRRTHYKVGERFTHDIAAMQGWPQIFGTSDKATVEKMAKMEDMPLRWEGRNKDVFVSEYISEPFQLHPETKEPVWFNHSQVFHWTTFPAELFAAFRRTGDWRFFLHAILIAVFSIIKYGLLKRKMGLDVTFGDGTPISILEMHQIRKAIHKNMVFSRWNQGDILFIDNFSTSHGRQPTYDKGRKVVVAWSDPTRKANLMAEVNGFEE